MNIDNNEIELLNNIFNSSVENTIVEIQEHVQNTVENTIQEAQEQLQNTVENTIVEAQEQVQTSVENTIVEAQEQVQTTVENTVENTIVEAQEQVQTIVENTINKLPKINKTLENTINDSEFKTYINRLNNINNNDSDNNSNNSDNNSDNGIETHNVVRFQNMSLNEIKTIDRFSNSLVLPSENSNISESEYSYTQNVKSPTTNYTKPIKHIRATKSQTQVDGIEEIDYVYNKLQDYVRYMTINRTNYIVIICKAIEIIENYKELKNSKNKKNIVTKSLNRIISLDLELIEFDKHLFINTMSNLIDLIINCTKKIDSNNTIKQNTVYDDDIILAKSGQIIHSLIDKLTTIVVKKHYCIEKMLANITTLTHILMILVDKYIYLSGLEKKLIVIQSINSFIKDRLQFIMEIDADKIEPLKLSLDTVPIAIDLLISLKKGKYKINIKDEVYTHKVKKSIFNFKKKNKKKNILENYVY